MFRIGLFLRAIALIGAVFLPVVAYAAASNDHLGTNCAEMMSETAG
jgi:hypothetical protein